MSKGIRRFLLATTIYSSSLMASSMPGDGLSAAVDKAALDHLVSSYGVFYDYHVTPRAIPARKSPLRGIVMEDLAKPQESWGVRHGHAVAAMADRRADHIAQADIQIDLIDEDAIGVYFLNDPANLLLSPIAAQADVVGLSYVLDRQKSSRFISDDDVKSYDHFWDGDRPLVLQAAGNSNKGLDGGLESEQATAMMRHGRYLQVGSVLQNREGRLYVPSYSARVGPAFVAAEGFDKDFKYQYLEDEASLRARLGKLLMQDGNAARLLVRGGRECASDPRVAATRDALLHDGEQRQDLKDAYNAAITDCFVRRHNQSTQIMRYEQSGTNVRMLGTSFAQPEAMGMVLGTLDLYHNRLTRDDVMALTMLAAEPVPAFESAASEIHDKLQYQDNGTGVLAYNFNIAGYGRLSADALSRHAQAMAALRAENPSLTTAPRRVSSPWVQAHRTPQEFVIDISDDVLALNTMLEIRLPANTSSDRPQDATQATSAGVAPQPESGASALIAVKLTSPQGVTFEIPISGGAQTLSFANSPAFMGNPAKGVWVLTLPPGIEAIEARLSIYGVARHGLIEAYIDQRRKLLPPSGLVNFDKPPAP